MEIIRFINVTKSYGKTKALDDKNLVVNEGDTYGFGFRSVNVNEV